MSHYYHCSLDDNEKQGGANEGRFVIFRCTIFFSAAKITIEVNQNSLFFNFPSCRIHCLQTSGNTLGYDNTYSRETFLIVGGAPEAIIQMF